MARLLSTFLSMVVLVVLSGAGCPAGPAGGIIGGGGKFYIQHLGIYEETEVLELYGEFGDTAGEVYVNGSARALIDDWSPTLLKVKLNRDDLGQVYVVVGDKTSNSRWITGWDFTIRRTLALSSVCSSCQAKMTFTFRMRGDAQTMYDGQTPATLGATGNNGMRGATFKIDSVNGSHTFDHDGQTRVWSREETSPTHYIGPSDGQFISGDGEWFSIFASVDPGNQRAVVAVHVDTDGYRVTNLDTAESNVEHISDFGVHGNINHNNTMVMTLLPSLGILSGSKQTDIYGSMYEWEAVSVKNAPPP